MSKRLDSTDILGNKINTWNLSVFNILLVSRRRSLGLATFLMSFPNSSCNQCEYCGHGACSVINGQHYKLI